MAASCVAVVAMKEHSVAKKNMSGPDMIMIHFTGGKACITKKTKNYVGSAVDLQFITAIFVFSAKCEGVGFHVTTIFTIT